MIVHAFLRWVETARAADRAKAASVLARAYARARIAATRVLGYEQRVKGVLPTPNFPELIPRFQALLLQLDRVQGEDVREPLRQLLEHVSAQGRQALVSDLWLSYADACAACDDDGLVL